jgi:hypothetical protein
MDDMLTDERLRSVIELAAAIARGGRAFRVFPPAEVTQDASVLDRDDAAVRLVGTRWWLRFADGGEHLLTFPELMVLTHNLVGLLTRAARGPAGGYPPSVPDLLNPRTVRFLLSKLELEGVPRDQYRPTFPLYGVRGGQAGASPELQGCTDPDTGLDLVFAFSDRDAAERLAAQVPGAETVLVATNVGELQALLGSTAAHGVAFDPAFDGNRFRARHTLLIRAASKV